MRGRDDDVGGKIIKIERSDDDDDEDESESEEHGKKRFFFPHVAFLTTVAKHRGQGFARWGFEMRLVSIIQMGERANE